MMEKNFFARKSVYILIFVLVFGLGAFMLSGCGNGNPGADKAVEENPESTDMTENDVPETDSADEMAETIFEQLEFEDEMTKVSDDLFFGLFNLDEEKVQALAAYESTGATAEEIVVTVAAEGCEADVRAAFAERVESQKESFRDYVPKELEKLSDAVIFKKGKIAILVVCNDSSKANKILEEI